MKLEYSQAQMLFAEAGYYKGGLDGDPEETLRVAKVLLDKHEPKGWRRWPAYRQIVGAVQVILEAQSASDNVLGAAGVDGWYGHLTADALEAWQTSLLPKKARPAPISRKEIKNPAPAPNPNNILWPRQRNLREKFGNPADRSNHTRMKFPYEMRLAWNTDAIVKTTIVHKKIKKFAEAVFEDVLDHYGEDGIRDLGLDLFGGCYNPRKMRGGSSWSMHAWAIAFDFDPANNRLRWNHKRAKMAGEEYKPWFAAWNKQGAIGLGPERDFDWMHTQFARL